MNSPVTSILAKDRVNTVRFLTDMIAEIRPQDAGDVETAKANFHALIRRLKSDADFCIQFRNIAHDVLSEYHPVYLLSKSGILGSKTFAVEFWDRLKHKILPVAYDDSDIRLLINSVLTRQTDYIWLQNIPVELWYELMEIIDVYGFFGRDTQVSDYLIHAIQLLSHDIASLGLDPEVVDKLNNSTDFDSPFMDQNKEIIFFVELFKGKNPASDRASFQTIDRLLNHCVSQILELRTRKNEFGISLHLTFLTTRILQKIERLRLLLNIFQESNENVFNQKIAHLSLQLIQAEKEKNSLRKLLKNNVDLLAYEIVEHAARKGGKYIANSASEYWSYLRAGMIGGLVIAVFALFKVLISKLSLAPVGEGLLFSINYALCFVLIYLFGGVVATKQPAMTASSVARSMDTNNDGYINDLNGLKAMIIKVSRSQFISLIGNLILALPFAFIMIKIFMLAGGTELISSAKVTGLFEEIHPTKSGALFYAAIAGIFLSVSGLFSGYVSNKVIFSKIPRRIRLHNGLRRLFSERGVNRFADYVSSNLAALSGNVALGFFLGMAGTFGAITGLPFDIRHVAFSSANAGFFLAAEPFVLDFSTILIIAIGVLGIGFINFLVSFGLTLSLALKSRKITSVQSKKLVGLLFGHFLRAPQDFFIYPSGKLQVHRTAEVLK